MKLHIFIAIVSLILAIVIFTFADGAKRIYSGGFFALIGIVNLLMATKNKT
jgi:hypothetical protein